MTKPNLPVDQPNLLLLKGFRSASVPAGLFVMFWCQVQIGRLAFAQLEMFIGVTKLRTEQLSVRRLNSELDPVEGVLLLHSQKGASQENCTHLISKQ